MAAGTIEVVADLSDPEYQSGMPKYDAVRKIGFGGSDAPTACGLTNRFGRTPYTLWAQKISESSSSHFESEAMSWGKLLEDPIRQEFSRRTGVDVLTFPRMVRNTARPFMLASVDGVTVAGDELTGVYEGKTSRHDWLEGEEVEIPLDYQIQGQHYLAVLELEVVHFACLVGGNTLRITELPRNDALIEDLVAIEADLWQHVLDGVPPRVEAGDKPMLGRRWTGDVALEVEISEAVAEQLRIGNALREQISTLEDARDAADALVMSALGEAAVGRYRGDIAVTWKPQPAVEVKAFTRKAGRRFLPKPIPPAVPLLEVVQ